MPKAEILLEDSKGKVFHIRKTEEIHKCEECENMASWVINKKPCCSKHLREKFDFFLKWEIFKGGF